MVLFSMTGEMLYILEQRLQAQSVAPDKTAKVLGDVVRTLTGDKFLAELFRPQEQYQMSSVRRIFERLAHSSVMKLSTQSMDKLFDLMLMAFKYQVMSASCAHDLVALCNNHLVAMQRMVGADTELVKILQDVQAKFAETYQKLSNGDVIEMRATVLRLLQDKRVKVSVFLNTGRQSPKGVLYFTVGGPLPVGIEMPGQIRYFDLRGKEANTETFDAASKDTPRQEGYVTALGTNIYTEKDTHKAATPKPHSSAPSTAPSEASKPTTAPVVATHEKDTRPPPVQSGAQAELRLLSHMIASDTTNKSAPPIVISMFDKDGSSTGSGSRTHKVAVKASHKESSHLEKLSKEMSNPAPAARSGVAAAASGGDDLLDLMDSAT
eukprot:TRINITY_DN8309_c0_g1_i1.p1 TRINITY_DN8309_c0_g1~~TRINITY_DN8309_c0_g1_i1.p1  ORF type:complete len:389 (-),score=114.23 TRINITY_DN8309_c0_g1_i1:43-1179(-)